MTPKNATFDVDGLTATITKTFKGDYDVLARLLVYYIGPREYQERIGIKINERFDTYEEAFARVNHLADIARRYRELRDMNSEEIKELRSKIRELASDARKQADSFIESLQEKGVL